MQKERGQGGPDQNSTSQGRTQSKEQWGCHKEGAANTQFGIKNGQEEKAEDHTKTTRQDTYWIEASPKYQKYKREDKEKKKERDRRYREENKKKLQEYRQRYYRKNKDKIQEKKRRYKQQNKEKLREQSRRYREENKEKIRDYQKHYYEKRKERRAANLTQREQKQQEAVQIFPFRNS